jgi:hypothetical protein
MIVKILPNVWILESELKFIEDVAKKTKKKATKKI